MEIFQLISLLDEFVVPFIVGVCGAFSFFFYARIKLKGFVVIGTAFVIQAAFLVALNPVFYYSSVINGNNFILTADLFSVFSFTFAMIFAVLLFVGLILLFTEVKPKTTPQLPDAKI